MSEPGLGWDFEQVAGPMRRAAVGQPCQGCGRIMTSGRTDKHAATVDHVVPRVLGGGCDPGNLRVLCRSCNSRLGRALRTRLERARKSQGRRRPRVLVPVGRW